jgi:DNA-binding MarR family transcriptional regulator
MDAVYWKSRCEAAESALQRARTAVECPPTRVAVLRALSGLRPTEALRTGDLAQRLGWTQTRVLYVAAAMARVGLVDRDPADHPPRHGDQVRWRLGHLVQVPEESA